MTITEELILRIKIGRSELDNSLFGTLVWNPLIDKAKAYWNQPCYPWNLGAILTIKPATTPLRKRLNSNRVTHNWLQYGEK